MRQASLIGLVALALGACTTAATGPHVVVSDRLLQVDLGTLEVAPGDTFTCFSTGYVTDREYAVGGAVGVQGEGGHHLGVYWTTNTETFAPRPCTEADMINWNFIAAVGGEPGAGDDQRLPAGLAFRVPAGAHIVVQSHYINVSGAPARIHDSIDIELLSPTEIIGYASQFAVNDGALEVPPRARYRRVSECHVTQPLSLVLLLGHMHEHGRHFSLELTRAGSTTPEMLYDHPWEAAYTSHAPVIRWSIDAPMELAVGDVLRQTCEWENTTADPIVFPSEMCITATYYFPDVGEGLIVCDPTVLVEETL